MSDKSLADDKAIIAQVLDKIELAARRVVIHSNNPSSHLLHQFANEIKKISETLYE